MRKIGVLLGTFALGLVLVNLVTGQQEAQKKRFGGGGFGFGGFGAVQTSPIALINNEQVQKELDITPEQLEKVPEAIDKALAEVLNPKQSARLRQISLQLRGPRAFTDAKVQKDLKMTEEQVTSVKSILDDSTKEAAEIRKEAQAQGDFQGSFQKIATQTMEANDRRRVQTRAKGLRRPRRLQEEKQEGRGRVMGVTDVRCLERMTNDE